ncbi:MAG: mannose-1-phosphate guanylyltransferase [Verrucomicrobiae bacterium]|nr:mannose-1-phosphate guanylyltransferase [Verrucomicrobiae bacterium]
MKPSPHYYAVIMAGGGGERFWPMSRMRTPKQLLALVTERTLIEETVARIEPVFPLKNILIITNTAQAPKIRKLLPHIPKKNIIAEPMRRDTAAAVALGTVIVARRNPNAVMAVLPADHVIKEPAKYQRVLVDCLELAGREKVLVTIGIKPTEPNTGYGYIEAGKKRGTKFWDAKRFVEKPDLATAKKYVASGRYRWNAGMFVWSAAAVSEALDTHIPELFSRLRTLHPAIDTPRFSDALRKLYPKLQRVSIDYGLMEKAQNVVVADGSFAWDDVGSWVALERHLPRDAHGNVSRGKLVSLRSQNNIVIGDKRLIATLGVRDLIIVETKDATLICHRDEAQKIKEIVTWLGQHPEWKKHVE